MRNESLTRPFGIIDTTFRDGAQSPVLAYQKYMYTQEDKLRGFEALHKYGVRFAEFFSPIVNPAEGSDLVAIVTRRDALEKETGKRTNVLAHVRCDPRDVEEAILAGVDGLNFYMGTSNESRQNNHRKSLDQIVGRARPLIEDVRRNHPSLLLRFSGEDAFRTNEEDLYRVYDPLADLVDRFGTPDTVGTAHPRQVRERVQQLKSRYPGVALEGHFHNDRQFATINALEAVHAGMEYVNTTILGLAERSGITSMTALVFNLYLENPELVNGFDLKSSYAINVLFADMLGMQVPTDEPVSLTNKTHSAGVHGGAIIRDPNTYEAHGLERFGVEDRALLLGPLSGAHIVHYFLREKLYVDATREQAQQITTEFKQRVEEIRNGTTPSDLLRGIASDYQLPFLPSVKTHIENI